MEMIKQLTPFQRLYYAACALVLLAWCLGFGAWMLLSTYPPILYP